MSIVTQPTSHRSAIVAEFCIKDVGQLGGTPRGACRLSTGLGRTLAVNICCGLFAQKSVCRRGRASSGSRFIVNRSALNQSAVEFCAKDVWLGWQGIIWILGACRLLHHTTQQLLKGLGGCTEDVCQHGLFKNFSSPATCVVFLLLTSFLNRPRAEGGQEKMARRWRKERLDEDDLEQGYTGTGTGSSTNVISQPPIAIHGLRYKLRCRSTTAMALQ